MRVLPDYLLPGLRVVFCGTAVSTTSAARGHYYAGPGNEFWPLLHESGLTPVLLRPDEDARVLEFALGLTDLAKTVAASSDAGLGAHYDIEGFVRKIERFAPAWLAFHGKTAGKTASEALGYGTSVSLGPQRWFIGTTAVFVLPSASAANRDPKRLEGRTGSASWPMHQHETATSADVSQIGQPTPVISFHQLIGAGDKDGARATFERLIAQLVGLRYQGVKIVASRRGDWGLDVIVGEIDDVLSVWQAKFFIDGLEEAQKAQIRESLSQVMDKAAEEGFTVNVWTLCIPVDLDPDALKWWTGWKKRQETAHGIRIELWARTDLETVLLSPDAAHIRSAYFPGAPGAAPSLPPVHELPEDLSYEDMLFIRQLQAAQIVELDSAKQQLFNAEALAREVADKRVAEHMQALQAERADLRSIWEDRYNRACGVAEGADSLLPELHPEVMEAIERRHDSGRVEVLPMHLIHRKGAMHQVVENGSAGWVRDFRAVAEGHRA